jgi:hypothetical protein
MPATTSSVPQRSSGSSNRHADRRSQSGCQDGRACAGPRAWRLVVRRDTWQPTKLTGGSGAAGIKPGSRHLLPVAIASGDRTERGVDVGNARARRSAVRHSHRRALSTVLHHRRAAASDGIDTEGVDELLPLSQALDCTRKSPISATTLGGQPANSFEFSCSDVVGMGVDAVHGQDGYFMVFTSRSGSLDAPYRSEFDAVRSSFHFSGR